MKSRRPVEPQGYSGRVRSLVLLLVAAACVVVAAGCGAGSSEDSAAQSSTPAETTSTTTLVREPAPMIEGTSVDGQPISLADYRGHAVLVNVWSSW